MYLYKERCGRQWTQQLWWTLLAQCTCWNSLDSSCIYSGGPDSTTSIKDERLSYVIIYWCVIQNLSIWITKTLAIQLWFRLDNTANYYGLNSFICYFVGFTVDTIIKNSINVKIIKVFPYQHTTHKVTSPMPIACISYLVSDAAIRSLRSLRALIYRAWIFLPRPLAPWSLPDKKFSWAAIVWLSDMKAESIRKKQLLSIKLDNKYFIVIIS